MLDRLLRPLNTSVCSRYSAASALPRSGFVLWAEAAIHLIQKSQVLHQIENHGNLRLSVMHKSDAQVVLVTVGETTVSTSTPPIQKFEFRFKLPLEPIIYDYALNYPDEFS